METLASVHHFVLSNRRSFNVNVSEDAHKRKEVSGLREAQSAPLIAQFSKQSDKFFDTFSSSSSSIHNFRRKLPGRRHSSSVFVQACSDVVDNSVDFDTTEEPANTTRNGNANSEYFEGGQGAASTAEREVPDHLLPTVAIVGRPNVGKSALFNCLAGKALAVVFDEPGVTRDRLYARAFWGAQEFMVVDTGGVISVPSMEAANNARRGRSGQGSDANEGKAASLSAMVERQSGQAVEDADAVVLVVDGLAGVSAVDMDIVAWLRRRHPDKPLTLAVNKCETAMRASSAIAEFWSLGLEPFPVSAITASGTGDLLDAVCAGLLPSTEEDERVIQEEEEGPLAVAIVGRPNVGKSSIFNALAGEERTIVSPESGTTRDAIDTIVKGADGEPYLLVDTAGMRKRAAVASGGSKAEALSVKRALRAVRRADCVLLVIDALECATEQDCRLGELIEREGKACVIVVNKWDTVPEKDSRTTLLYDEDLRLKLRALDWAPILYTSATSGQRIPRILEMARQVGDQRERRLPTATLNRVMQEAAAFRPPPAGQGGRRGRIYYCTQAATKPPTFVFFVNDSKLFDESYRRYMEKQIRQNVSYAGTPIRLVWRSKKSREEMKRETSNNSQAGRPIPA